MKIDGSPQNFDAKQMVGGARSNGGGEKFKLPEDDADGKKIPMAANLPAHRGGITQVSAGHEVVASAEPEHAEGVQDFIDFLEMSPAERMREVILRGMGLSEEKLDAMDPEDRAKLEQEIAAKIKERIVGDVDGDEALEVNPPTVDVRVRSLGS